MKKVGFEISTTEGLNPGNKDEYTAKYIWNGIVDRCRRKRFNNRNYCYANVSMCDEWSNFNNFKEWFEKQEYYFSGYQIDKDILVKGNKIYSPSTCCFVPMFINSVFTNSRRNRGKYPIGVSYIKGKFMSTIRETVDGKRVKLYLGLYNNPIDAFEAYKKEKESYIKRVAEQYKKVIAPSVYNAMYNYKVLIDD
jgi:hypothetical protein